MNKEIIDSYFDGYSVEYNAGELLVKNPLEEYILMSSKDSYDFVEAFVQMQENLDLINEILHFKFYSKEELTIIHLNFLSESIKRNRR